MSPRRVLALPILWIAIFFCVGLISTEAIAQTDHDTSQASNQTELLYQQADLAVKDGEYNKALALFNQVLRLTPGHVNALWNRADLYYRNKEYASAVADLERLAKLRPQNPLILGKLGWLQILQGQWQKARQYSLKAHALDPETMAWAINLGHTYLYQGDRAKAYQYYREGLLLIQKAEVFETGPKADFELFIKKGWFAEDAGSALEWAKESYARLQDMGKMNFEQLKAAIQGDDFLYRQRAAMLLGMKKNLKPISTKKTEPEPQDVPDWLRDDDGEIPDWLLDGLAQERVEESYNARLLVTALSDAYPGVRRQAAVSLGALGEKKSGRSLISLVEDPDDRVREAAISALGKLKSRDAFEAVAKALNDPNPKIRSAALNNICAVGMPDDCMSRIVPLLLNTKDKAFLDEVARVLLDKVDLIYLGSSLELTPEAVKQLISMSGASDKLLSRAAVHALTLVSNPVLMDFYTAQLRNNHDIDVRHRVVERLIQLDRPQARPLLLEALKDTSSQVRFLAAKGLWEIEKPASANALVELIRSSNEVAGAADFLFKTNDIDAIHYFLYGLTDLEKIKDHLFSISGTKGFKAVASKLNNPGDSLRLHLEKTLDFLEDPQEVILSLCALNGKGRKSRHSAARQFARIWAQIVDQYILAGLESTDTTTQHLAAGALWRLTKEVDVTMFSPFLKDDDKLVRDNVALYLGRMGYPKAVARLIKMLGQSESKDLRRASARALGHCKQAAALEPLIFGMADFQREDALSCARALDNKFFNSLISDIALSNDAISKLAQAVSKSEAYVRKVTAKMLSDIMDPRVVPALCIALKDKDVKIRRLASIGLFRIGDSRSLNALKDALDDVDLKVREIVGQAFARTNDEKSVEDLVRSLPSTGKSYAGEITQALIDKGLPGMLALVDAIKNSDREADEQIPSSFSKIADVPEEVVRKLIKLLEDPKPWVRRKAAVALGQLKDIDLTEPMGRLLKDPDDLVRYTAAVILSDYRDERAVDTLDDMLSSRVAGWVNPETSAVISLGKIGGPRAHGVLIKALKGYPSEAAAYRLSQLQLSKEELSQIAGLLDDEDPDVSYSALYALANHAGEINVDLLIKKLRDPDKKVRKQAATALKFLKNNRSVLPLILALKDPDDEVILQAAEALGEIGDLQAVEPLLECRMFPRMPVGEAVLKLEQSNRVFDAFVTGIDADSAYKRSFAIIGLGRLKNPKAVDILIPLLNHSDWYIRQNALDALGEIGDKRAFDAIVERMEHPQGNYLNSYDAFKILFQWDPGKAEIFLLNLAQGASVWKQEAFDFLVKYGEKTLQSELAGELLTSSFPRHTFREFIRQDSTALLYIFKDRRFKAFPYQDWINAMGMFFKHFNASDGTEKKHLSQMLKKDELHDPYLLLFKSYLLKEQGADRQAIILADKGLNTVLPHQTPLRLALYWVKAESLRATGKYQAALEIMNYAEALLPKITYLDRREVQLAFSGYTLAIKGLVQIDLGQVRAAQETLEQAQNYLDYDQEAGERHGRQVRKIIQAALSDLYLERRRQAADIVIALSEEEQASTRLEREAEEKALVNRIQIAVGEGEYETAHNYTERLQLRRHGVVRQAITLDLTDPEKQRIYENHEQLRGEVREIDNRIDVEKQQSTKDQEEKEVVLTALRKKRRVASRKLKSYFVELKQSYPEISAMIGTEPTQMAKLQKYLDKSQAIVQYLLTEDLGWVFAITRDNIDILELSVGRKKIGAAVHQYRDEIVSRTPVQDRAGRDLSEYLITPLKPTLHGIKHLIVVPNAELHFLPFAALPFEGGYLVEKYLISRISSSSLLEVVQRQEDGIEHLLAFANPQREDISPLPGAEQEVRAIEHFFPRHQSYLREAAQADKLKGMDLSGKVLHLALHGEAGDIDQTCLKFSDGDLGVKDVWGLQLDASPMVVLSACETQIGRRVSGDEVVSLSDGFLFAGARSVLATLWPVSDASTSQFMQTFYELKQNHSMSKVDALHQAQLSLLNGGWPGTIPESNKNRGQVLRKKGKETKTHTSKFSHPYYWAPFTLTGNWL